MSKILNLLIVLLLGFAWASCKRSPSQKDRIPSLEETYSYESHNPFGTYVLHDQLKSFFSKNELRINKSSLSQLNEAYRDTGALYYCVCRHFLLTPGERESFLEFIAKGNTAFISAADFDTALLGKLGLEHQLRIEQFVNQRSPFQNTGIHLETPPMQDSSRFNYHFASFISYFGLKDPEWIRVLGRSDFNKPNFVIIYHLKGRIYLHAEPRAFSNYFLLQDKNILYFYQTVSFLPAVPEHVIWDHYYYKRDYAPDENNKGGLSMLLKYPPLKWAFLVLLGLLFFFLLNGMRRRQRIIPVVDPVKNNTVAFTETVARLYLGEKNNRDIADKLIVYFMENVRTHYYLQTNHIHSELIQALSRKSGVSVAETRNLFDLIHKIQQEIQVSDADLLLLNQQMEKFFKQR